MPDHPAFPTAHDLPCLACGNVAGNRLHTAREMMVGLRDEFTYLECGDCGSLRIAEVPADLARYYGNGYYSFNPWKVGGIKRLLKHAQADKALGRFNPLGAILRWTRRPPEFAAWMHETKTALDDAILDVGCGSGHLLKDLRVAGFRNLQGIDPFLEHNRDEHGVRLRRASMSELNEKFDLVMLHHSFEHMSDPVTALRQVAGLLKPAGRALLRCPVSDCDAWRTYGTNWVQLDAPRHLFIPSKGGMTRLAETCGLSVSKITCDSTELQFEGSELYQRGIPLRSPDRATAFTSRERRAFLERARELNRAMAGDSACFYMEIRS